MTALVGATIIAPFGGYLVDYFGRKLSIILCSVPYAIGWLLIILTVETDNSAFKPLLFTGRFILGVGVGWTTTSVGVSFGNNGQSKVKYCFWSSFLVRFCPEITQTQAQTYTYSHIQVHTHTHTYSHTKTLCQEMHTHTHSIVIKYLQHFENIRMLKVEMIEILY